MDINNLVQTFFVMNMKDISKMSFKELLPFILFSIIYPYREAIFSYIFSYLKWDSYKSQIINEIIIISGDRDGRYVTYTKSVRSLLWHYKNNIKAVNMSKTLKEYDVRIALDKNVNGVFTGDIYIPPVNQTVKLNNDILLEFTHKTKSVGKDGLEEQKNITLTVKSKSMDIITLRKWIEELETEYLNWKEKETRQWLYTTTIGKDGLKFEHNVFNSTKTFDNLFFEQKELIINRLTQYKDIDRYKRLGIPHTLGFLFYGEPGCGKTSCIKAIANYLDRSIITINLKHIKNIDELRELFLNDHVGNAFCVQKKNTRIYVFEEIDCCVEDRDNPFLDRTSKVKEEIKEDSSIDKLATALLKDEKTELKVQHNKITTGEVLELLDGISETDDRIIIFTTNHPEKLDKAFMRPGRIDIRIEFKKLRRRDINDLYKLWYGKPIGEKALNKIKDYSLSQAEFGKLCFENTAEKVLDKLMS